MREITNSIVQVPSTPPSSSDEWYSQDQSFMYSVSPKSEDWFSSMASRVAVASLTSQGTIGGLLVSGFVSILSVACIVGLCSQCAESGLSW